MAATKGDTALYERLEAVAADCGISLRELTDLCGFTRTHVYRWKRQKPAVKSLERIAEKTGVNLHWLITGEGDMRAGPLPERYPNRARAVATARAWKVDESAIAVLYQLDPGSDMSPAWWFDQLPTSAKSGAK